MAVFFDIYVLILGLCLGSFVYTTAIRLANEDSLWVPSHCDFCQKKVGVIGLIPILGYLIRQGRCRSCKKKVSISYPVMEIINACLIYSIYLKIGFNLEFIYYTLIFESLFLIAILDFKTYLIFPHPILFCLIIQSLWLSFYDPTLWRDSIVGLFVGAGIFHFVSYLYEVIRQREGLGSGDATLLGIIGYHFGWTALFPVILVASLLGILGGGLTLLLQRKTMGKEIAFGPWLILAAFLVWHFPRLQSLFGNLS